MNWHLFISFIALNYIFLKSLCSCSVYTLLWCFSDLPMPIWSVQTMLPCWRWLKLHSLFGLTPFWRTFEAYIVIHNYTKDLLASELSPLVIGVLWNYWLFTGPVVNKGGVGGLWWIFILVALLLFLIILLLCCCLCMQRNKGDTYPGKFHNNATHHPESSCPYLPFV